MWFQLLLTSIAIASLAHSQTEAITEGQVSYKLKEVLREIKEILEKTQNDSDEYRRLLHLGEEWKYSAWSCNEIAERKTNKTSGWYWIQSERDSHPQLQFCDFEIELMGRKNWVRVFHLNMSDPQQHCPTRTTDFRLVTQDGLRLCGRTSGSGCKSVYINGFNSPYQRVCGHSIAFRYHTPDGFYRHNYCPGCTIENPYVDGISITRGGSGRRKHVWSFAMRCEGIFGTPPNFVGNNFFCEVPTHHHHNGLYSQDPLFAGRWFCVQLPQPTTEDLEMRVCGDEVISNEDSYIQFMELYIQ